MGTHSRTSEKTTVKLMDITTTVDISAHESDVSWNPGDKKKKRSTIIVFCSVVVAVIIILAVFLSQRSKDWEFDEFYDKSTKTLTFPVNYEYKNESMVISQHDEVRTIVFQANSFQELKRLNISDLQQLSSISILGPDVFESVEAVSFIKLPRLTSLLLSGSNILNNAKVFEIQSDSLKTISFGGERILNNTLLFNMNGLKSLQSFTLAGSNILNKISVLSLENMSALESFAIHGSVIFAGVSKIQYGSMTSLKSLSFAADGAFSGISTMEVHGLSSLSSLILGGSYSFAQCNNISIHDLPQLKKLVFSGEKAFIIASYFGLSNIPSLDELVFDADYFMNRVTSFTLSNLKVRSLTFGGVLSFNKVKQFSIQDLTMLNSLAFTGTQVFESLTSLRISGFPVLQSIAFDGYLNLYGIKAFELDNLPELKRFSMKGSNNIESIEEFRLSGLPKLEFVSFAEKDTLHNTKHFIITDCPLLKMIEFPHEGYSFFGDNLLSFTLSNLPSLTAIDMTPTNMIRIKHFSMTISNLTNLVSFRVHSWVSLVYCDSFILKDLPKLESFELTGSHLFYLSKGFALQDLPMLKSIFIEGDDQLAYITTPLILQNLPKLEVLTIHARLFSHWLEHPGLILTDLPKLKSVSIKGDYIMTKAGQLTITKMPSLETFIFESLGGLSEVYTISIYTNPKLKTVVLTGDEIGRSSTLIIDNLPMLTSLFLNGTQAFYDSEHISLKNLPLLEEFSIRTSKFGYNVKTVEMINLPSLKTMNISQQGAFCGANNITLFDMQALTLIDLNQMNFMSHSDSGAGEIKLKNLPAVGKLDLYVDKEKPMTTAFNLVKYLKKGPNVNVGMYSKLLNHLKEFGEHGQDIIEEIIV